MTAVSEEGLRAGAGAAGRQTSRAPILQMFVFL